MRNLEVKKYLFGYDLENVSRVEWYVRSEFNEVDYDIIVGVGDDVMNCLYINNRVIDDRLRLYISRCDGGGNFEE